MESNNNDYPAESNHAFNLDRPNPTENKEADTLKLQKRVAELEAKIAQLESGKSKTSKSTLSPNRATLPLLLLILTVAIASVPAILVVKDRWLDNPLQSNLIGSWWYALGLAEATSFQPYFLIVFLCILTVSILVFISRAGPQLFSSDSEILSSSPPATINPNQRHAGKILIGIGVFLIAAILLWTAFGDHIPGWDFLIALFIFGFGWFILDNPFVKGEWASRSLPILVMVLSTASLIVFLGSFYSKEGFLWIYGILLTVSLILLFQFRNKIPNVFWIFNLALIAYTLFINAWWFAVVGDEYSFYYYALELATRQSLSAIGERLFNGQGVYGAHPHMSSLIQALFMKVTGQYNFGWRFSNIFLSASAVAFFYLFFKVFVPRRVAVITALFLAGSEYLMTFGKIGYNNLQALFSLGLIMWAASYAIRLKNYWAYAMVGITIGSCFYVYPAALYTVLLPLLLLFFYDIPASRKTILRWCVLVLSTVVIISPLFFQPSYWSIKEAGTFLYNPEITQSSQALLGHLGRNLIYALLSFLYILEESHFIAVSYMDPVSGMLLLIGFFYALKKFSSSRFSKFWIISFTFMIFLVGASHDRMYPPSTRMFLLLPWFAFFASSGLVWIHNKATQLTPSRTIDLIIPITIFAVFISNFYQAYTISPTRLDQYQSIEALFLRIATQGEKIEPAQMKHYVVITQPNWGTDGLVMIQNVYQTPESPLQIDRVIISDENLAQVAGSEKSSAIFSESDTLLLVDANSIVMLQRFANEEWHDKVEAALKELGMTYCEARNYRGKVVMNIWHHGLYNDICK
jgi:hypothetical protein